MSYRTKVRMVEAFRWQGQPESDWPLWAQHPELLAKSGSALYAYTRHGPVRVCVGDWCVLGAGSKEITAYSDGIFNSLYEPVTPPIQGSMESTAQKDLKGGI